MTREEAIDYNKNLKMYMKLSDKDQPCKFLEENYIALDMAIEALKQEPKSGHWKIIPSNNNGEYRPNKYACSECGWTIDLCRGLQQDTGHRLFCEHCGAKMVEPQESEVEDAT